MLVREELEVAVPLVPAGSKIAAESVTVLDDEANVPPAKAAPLKAVELIRAAEVAPADAPKLTVMPPSILVSSEITSKCCKSEIFIDFIL